MPAGLFSADDLESALNRAGAQSKKVEDATARKRTSTSYGVMPTVPDEVGGLVVAKGDLLIVAYSALWNFGQAAIFLDNGGGAVQLKASSGNSPAVLVNAFWEGEPAAEGSFVHLTSSPQGLVSGTTNTSAGPSGEVVTTGMTMAADGTTRFEFGGAKSTIGTPGYANGGFCPIRDLAAGTYTVSVRFKSASGSVERKNMTLRAWVEAFA